MTFTHSKSPAHRKLEEQATEHAKKLVEAAGANVRVDRLFIRMGAASQAQLLRVLQATTFHGIMMVFAE